MPSPNFSLRIDTTDLAVEDDPVPPAPDTRFSARPVTSSTRERGVSFSRGVIPSLRISTVMPEKNSPHNADVAAATQGSQKAKTESRKLLSHLLEQLQSRTTPLTSDNSSSQTNGGSLKMEAVVKSVRDVISNKDIIDGRRRSVSDEDDEDVETVDEEAEFYTDATFDLMSQLKDVFIVASDQGWNLFSDLNGEEPLPGINSERDSASRPTSFLRRRSVQPGRRRSRSRSASPTRGSSVQAPELLSQCISILSSVVMADCRYQIASPRPLRPPNALQAVTLDVAQYLIHSHQDSPEVVSRIGFAMIYAFHTFKASMHARLLAFFDESVIGGMLERLSRIQRRADSLPTADTTFEDSASSTSPPVVAIMVDEAADDVKSPTSYGQWNRWSSLRSPLERACLSTNAPDQDAPVYHLSALLPPLLAAIVEKVDFFSTNLPTIYRLHLLLERLVVRKPDLYLDLLSVIAYHPPAARHTAISLLMTFWSNAVGHLVITKGFPDASYAGAVARIAERGVTAARQPSADYTPPYSHQFVPWRFRPDSGPLLYEGAARNECRVCSKPIRDFGLSCPLCMCSVHFDCYDYPDGSFLTQYAVVSDPDIQKVALHRFCYTLSTAHDRSNDVVRKAQHVFRPMNTFSLVLCFICRKPLWGCVKQGLRCGNCKHFAHSHCLSETSTSALGRCRASAIDSTHIFIEWSTLRRTFASHFRDMLFTEMDLRQKTYEELAVIDSVLWTQLQIMNNGIALGSIVVHNDNTPTGQGGLAEFELHYLVSLCEALLSSNNLAVSEALSDYLAENKTRADPYLMYFDFNNLLYVASILKMPPVAKMSSSGSTDLLSAGHPGHFDESSDDPQHPLEILPLAHLRDQLGDGFGITSDSVAKHFLSHLHHLGLLQPVKHQDLFSGPDDPKARLCCFPLPLGFDVSVDIETLVAAIEACLQDLDLSINEIGFLLLTRRFWPDGMLSDYTFRRLTRSILVWIFSEDDNLATILRDFVARGRTLPGVRVGLDILPWPNSSRSRPVAANSASNGGDYVASRRALAQRYVSPWLLAFHDRDINAYASLMYELTAEYAEGSYTDDYALLGITEEIYQDQRAVASDRMLRSIIKLCQASVVFTAFDDVFRRWLQRAYDIDRHEKPSMSLPKLFNKEVDASQRYSTVTDPRITMQDFSALANVNPLRDLFEAARDNAEGFVKGLHWLCLFVSSGVDVPVSLFREYASLACQFKANLDTCSMLLKAILWSCWLKSIGRQELQATIASLHAYLSSEILTGLKGRVQLPGIIIFIRQSLATCLLLFGCDRAGLIDMGMIEERDVQHLPSRRKMQTRASQMTDPVVIERTLTDALESYVGEAVDDVSCLIAKFFNAFVNESPLVESYEVDNFILRNGFKLCSCAWQFYGIEMTAVSEIRTSFLLRVLVVDVQPFQKVILDLLNRDDWEVRLQTVHRLFQIVADVTSPAFSVEDRQWRASVVDIFHHFFSQMWLDDREEVRMAIETSIQTLLPAHFDAIAMCWSEALNKVPVADRVRLTAFLSQLRAHFPTWRVLAWDAIMESLQESDFMQRNGDNEEGPASAYLAMYGVSDRPTSMMTPPDSDLVTLQAALVSLSLHMVADGLSIDVSSALKLKSHAFSLFGFRDVTLVSAGSSGHSFYVKAGSIAGITDWSHPCLSDLVVVFDSSHAYHLPPSAMGSPYSEDEAPIRLLVGSIFVDLLLEMFVHAPNLQSLPPLTLKNMLKALVIVVYKHDFDSKPLRHLQGSLRKAVRRSLDLLLDSIGLNYEVRQLCLTVCQAFIKAWPNIVGVLLCDAIESISKLLFSLSYEQNVDDPLVEQGRAFLEANLIMFSGSGVINALFKRRLGSEFFQVLRFIGETPTKAFSNSSTYGRLREVLLRDALSRCLDNDSDSFQLVIDNIGTYVEITYHSQYSMDLLKFVGHSITAVARKTADWIAGAFNASALLSLASVLIQHNKGQSREFLTLVEGFLRVALVRSYLSVESLSGVLRVTASLYRKAGSPEQCLTLNHIASFILEQLTDKLNNKAHITSSTLISLLEVFTVSADNDPPISLSYERYATLADAGFAYLYADGIGASSVAGFAASQAVANLVLQVAEDQPQILSKVANSSMPVRAWNLILLAVLSSNSTAVAATLFDYFPGFSFVYYRTLSAYQHYNYDGSQEVAHADISKAYAAIKLWMLLCRKATAIQEVSFVRHSINALDKESTLTRRIWNELWPPFEAVLTVMETDPQAEDHLALVSTVSSSVSDLFLFLRQSRSVTALDAGAFVAVLNRLRTLGRSDAKITRVLQQITESPPDVSFDYFVQQTRTEIWAEEKLEAAKREETARNPPDKVRTRVVS